MQSRVERRGIVWGGFLILGGVVGLVQLYAELSAWAWVAVLAVGGLAALLVYLGEPSDWGLLVPAYVLWAIAALIGLVELNVLRGSFVATFVLAAIALPFVVAFLRNRERWGVLIPAYVLLAIGVMVSLIEQGALHDELIAAYIMLIIALPFFAVYAGNRKQWWPLIPGGIMGVIGLSFILAEAAVEYVVPAALLIAGGWMIARQIVAREPKGPDE
jgi:hypothetical protein